MIEQFLKIIIKISNIDFIYYIKKGNEIKKKDGLIKKIYEDTYIIVYFCENNSGSFGTLLNLKFLKIATKNKGAQLIININLGIFVLLKMYAYPVLKIMDYIMIKKLV